MGSSHRRAGFGFGLTGASGNSDRAALVKRVRASAIVGTSIAGRDARWPLARSTQVLSTCTAPEPVASIITTNSSCEAPSRFATSVTQVGVVRQSGGKPSAGNCRRTSSPPIASTSSSLASASARS
jgi:hypothetical protein